MTKPSIWGLRLNDLAEELQASGVKLRLPARVVAKQIYQWIYQQSVSSFEEMTNLSQDVRVWLQNHLDTSYLTASQQQLSKDGTQKFLWKLHDGATVESVAIPVEEQGRTRTTLCISSQVGCAMRCQFCVTGTQKLERNLSAAEIVAQVLTVRQLSGVDNIVFMGMGEPLHNVDAVIQACQILLDEMGLNFSKRKITVSTSGLVPAIEKLGKETGVKLAISLNAANDKTRNEIMPVNKKWNIETLLKAGQSYPSSKFRMVTYEYILLKGVNDSLEDAKDLIAWVRRFPAKINLIPFNEAESINFQRPSDEVVNRFHQFLVDHKITATVRKSRGRDIAAACGQLKSRSYQ